MIDASNMMQLVQKCKGNPVQMLMQMKMNVPSNIANDPNAILNHLMSTGQVSQEQVNRAYQMAQMFR